MKLKETKYEKLLSWVDSLPASQEFTFAEAKKAFEKTPKPIAYRSCSSIIAPLVKQGLISCREENSKRKFWSKTEQWSKKKALDANYQRLCQKWQKYKPKK